MNFGDLPEVAGGKVAILPVPFDATSTWMKGADKGPQAIIEASAHMELYDIETDSEVYNQGITTFPTQDYGNSPEQMVESVRAEVSRLIGEEKFVVVIGGDHSVSIGTIYAHAQAHGKLSVLQLDAHADMRDEYNGSRYNHACVMARASEACDVVQVGIRSMDIAEKGKGNVFLAQDIVGKSAWIEDVIKALAKDVYITLDLDVFDPSIMPSTGTPEPGGLLWYDTLEFLKEVFTNKNVVGFDVVELCPNSVNKAPDFLAAKLIYKMISYKFSKGK